jgi:hypothetical protein
MTRLLKLLHATALALALGATAVNAQVRSLPAEAKRGEIRHLQEMVVAINGRPMQLAPGAQIRDTANRIVMPAAVPPGALVRFTLDAQGHLSRVWILTPEEAAQPEPRS